MVRLAGIEPTSSHTQTCALPLRYSLFVCDISRHRLSRKSWRDEQALPLQGPSRGSTAFQAAAVTYSACRPVVSCRSRHPSAGVVSRGTGPADCGPAPTGDRRKGSSDSDASFTGGT